MKQFAPATQRNREPLLAHLRDLLPTRGVVLELASGTGEHAVHFAAGLPSVIWQPSDPDADARASIAAWRAQAALPNLRPPLAIDVMAQPWPLAAADLPLAAMVAINMIHISPLAATEALMAGAGAHLADHGVLVTYGPYRFVDGIAPSNVAFDADLRARNPAWGVRAVRDLEAVAATHGLVLRQPPIALPANNHVLVFGRSGPRA